ncbi:gas vesicle protein [Streptomyces sp. OZ13]|uniref:gas vesicle protein GvpO n=1 Tax=Streptomyces sp. OZ13 TaxID=3452210 RepID=UPI003F894BFE
MGRTPENTADTEKTSDTKSADSAKKSETSSSDRERGGRPLRAVEVLRAAGAQLAELTGMTAESVSSFSRTEDGWQLVVEVLELARVPDTASLLASYEVEVDRDGELISYRRTRRYERGRADRSSS